MVPNLIAIGTSLGGLKALQILLRSLPANFSVPITIVQHRGKTDYGGVLISLLQQQTSLIVKEPEDKEALESGSVYLAPSDYHFLIERGRCALSLESPVNHARPSVDVLFESAAVAYGAGVIAVVLTGSNGDGARGAACIKAAGGIVVVQDPQECESSVMPISTIAAGGADHILKLGQISDFLIESCGVSGERINGRG